MLASLLMASAVSAQSGTNAAPQQAPNASCAKAALQKRDATVATAVDAFAAAFKNALLGRTSAVSGALDTANKKNRKNAMKKAAQAFRDGKKSARKIFDASRKSAWDAFRTDMKACGETTADEHGNAGQDNL